MSSYGSRRPQTQQGSPKPPNWDVIMGKDPVASAKELVRSAEAWGRYLAQDLKLSTSQIRTVFGEVRRIEMSWAPGETNATTATSDLLLLKPKLAYQAARDAEKNRRTTPVQALANILTPGIDRIGTDRDRFQRFVDFFEAVLAYHKAAGGKS